jgi:hypothetical protein
VSTTTSELWRTPKAWTMDPNEQKCPIKTSGHCAKENYKVWDPLHKPKSWCGAMWICMKKLMDFTIHPNRLTLVFEHDKSTSSPFCCDHWIATCFLLFDFGSILTCRNGYGEGNKMSGKQMVTLFL